jgi:hypothetical protein
MPFAVSASKLSMVLGCKFISIKQCGLHAIRFYNRLVICSSDPEKMRLSTSTLLALQKAFLYAAAFCGMNAMMTELAVGEVTNTSIMAVVAFFFVLIDDALQGDLNTFMQDTMRCGNIRLLYFQTVIIKAAACAGLQAIVAELMVGMWMRKFVAAAFIFILVYVYCKHHTIPYQQK